MKYILIALVFDVSLSGGTRLTNSHAVAAEFNTRSHCVLAASQIRNLIDTNVNPPTNPPTIPRQTIEYICARKGAEPAP